MRLMMIGMLGIFTGLNLTYGGESPGETKPAEKRVAWIAVPGEATLMRVENPPEGLVVHEAPLRKTRGLDQVHRSVNRELRDVAQALRGLDQSYAIRGFQGCGAATAGSVFIDWRAKGLRQPENVVVLPPPPIVLGIPKVRCCCERCHRELITPLEECDCAADPGAPALLPPTPAPLPEPTRQ